MLLIRLNISVTFYKNLIIIVELYVTTLDYNCLFKISNAANFKCKGQITFQQNAFFVTL